MSDPVADAADRLYGLDLDAFTGERDRAAKALRKEDRTAADAIAKLRKPSPQAWAANRVARERPELRDELLAAGGAVRGAQEAALAGKGRDALRAATSRMRAAVDAFLDAAREQRPGDRALSTAAANRLRTTLQAAAADDAVRAGLETGRLVGDAEAGGAWPLPGADGGAGAPAKPKRAAPEKEPKTKPARAATKAPKRDREAERREREAAERRRELESRLRSARADSTARERELARAEREADRTARRLERALADAEEARTHAEDASADAAAARTAAGEARDEVARLEEQLD